MQMAEQIELDLVGPKKIGHIIIDVEYIWEGERRRFGFGWLYDLFGSRYRFDLVLVAATYIFHFHKNGYI
jgi:hypothetical protein